MKIFIDGMSFMRGAREVAPELVDADAPEETRSNVARWCARYAEMQDCDVKLVFAANVSDEILPPVEEYGRVTVRNLTENERMSREICGPANRESSSNQVFVVTDEPRFERAVRGGEARLLTPQEFIERARRIMGKEQKARYEEPDEKYSGVSDEEVDFWMDYFGDKDS